MIEGLKFRFSSEDLVKHIKGRIKHHESRIDFYEKQAKEFKENAEEAEIRRGQNSYVRTHEEMKSRVQDHSKRMQFFMDIVDHVIPGETYQFNLRDMQEIEIGGGGSHY